MARSSQLLAFAVLFVCAVNVACGKTRALGSTEGGADATDDGALQTDGQETGAAAQDTSAESPDAGGAGGAPGVVDGGWRSLFDGGSLGSFDTYLGVPADGAAPYGLDDDPKGVFSVVTVDGAPAIHVTGEVWGALISKETFCDFHLRAQYKWGTKVWPPLNFRDCGIMYLSTGPLGAVNAGGKALSQPIGSGAFMVSMEYQIAPGDVGGMYDLGPISFASLGRTPPVDSATAWNDVDIVFEGGVATHELGGAVVARGEAFTIAWPGQGVQPLACGKLQLQSEGGELYFRGLQIKTSP